MRTAVFAALALSVLPAGGSWAAPKTLTVPEVIARHKQLNHHVVLVRGWLDVCEHLSCGLFASRKAAIERQYGSEMLSIGYSKEFDRKAASLHHAEILLSARIDATCFGDPTGTDEVVVCTDRADELQPIRIERVLSAAPPAQSKKGY